MPHFSGPDILQRCRTDAPMSSSRQVQIGPGRYMSFERTVQMQNGNSCVVSPADVPAFAFEDDS